MESGRIQLYKYCDEHFNVHHSVSENYEDPFTKLHMHSMYELYVFLEGEGVFSVSGNSYPLTPGMVMFMRPGEAHSLTVVPHKRYERIAIHFEGSYFDGIPYVNSMLKTFAEMESGTGNCFYFTGNNDYCLKLISEMTRADIANDNDKLSAICANLPALLYCISNNISHNSSVSSADSDKLIRQIIKYIDENLYGNWNLDNLAAALYRDKAYLNRRFKKVVGTGIWDYTIRKRIIGIKQQMHSFSSVNEAFKASGFGDYSSFFRNYVKITGNTPSDDISVLKLR